MSSEMHSSNTDKGEIPKSESGVFFPEHTKVLEGNGNKNESSGIEVVEAAADDRGMAKQVRDSLNLDSGDDNDIVRQEEKGPRTSFSLSPDRSLPSKGKKEPGVFTRLFIRFKNFIDRFKFNQKKSPLLNKEEQSLPADLQAQLDKYGITFRLDDGHYSLSFSKEVSEDIHFGIRGAIDRFLDGQPHILTEEQERNAKVNQVEVAKLKEETDHSLARRLQENGVTDMSELIPDADEERIGVFKEMLEFQVRDAVIHLAKKGYKTTYSGINEKYMYTGRQMIGFEKDSIDPLLFSRIQTKAQEFGIDASLKPNKINGEDLFLTPGDGFRDMKTWKYILDEIVELFPDKGTPIEKPPVFIKKRGH